MHPVGEHVAAVTRDALVGAVFVLPVDGDDRQVGAAVADAVLGGCRWRSAAGYRRQLVAAVHGLQRNVLELLLRWWCRLIHLVQLEKAKKVKKPLHVAKSSTYLLIQVLALIPSLLLLLLLRHVQHGVHHSRLKKIKIINKTPKSLLQLQLT